MVQVGDSLAQHLLSLPKGWTEARRLDTVAAVFMLFDWRHAQLFPSLREGLEQGRFAVDAQLLADLYATCPIKLKIELLNTPACGFLDPVSFKSLFRDAWSLGSLTASQRESLLYVLRGFFNRHPDRGFEYSDIILESLDSKNWHFHIPVFLVAGYLNEIPPHGLLRMKRGMRSANTELRMTAHNGLCMLVKRRREVSPAVNAFCLAPDVQSLAERIEKSDPSEDVRLCAHYLVKALRQARRTR